MTMEISAAINKAKIPDLINGGIEIRPDRNNRNWKADTSSPLRSRKAAADEADHGFEVISGYRSTPKKTLLLISGLPHPILAPFHSMNGKGPEVRTKFRKYSDAPIQPSHLKQCFC